MTLNATTNTVSYTGNNSTTSFTVTFAFQGTGATSELEVVERVIATGVETVKSYSTHYTVTGGNGSTGTVIAASAPADTVQWHIRRLTTETQLTDYVENDAFPAESHEDALDRLTMILQEHTEELNRSFKVSRTNSITTPEFTDDASTRASKLLGFSSDRNTLEAITGRVNSVSVSTVAPTNGAAGSATASFTASTGALALGVPQGSTGIGGVSMQYSTTTTDSDPGAGFIRLNNTSLNSATIMYVDDSDGTTDISAWVQSWDNSSSGSKGFITLSGNPNPASPLVIYKVTGTVTDASGYTKVPVAYVAGSTSISNSAEISVQFSPAGDGDVAGLDYTFSTTTSDADPGTGVLRLNHGTLGSVSQIFIDDSDANSADVSAFLLTWDDSTNSADRGQIYITKKSAPANYAIYKVSGASTDASGYVKLAVTHVSSNGSFSDTDPIAVEFNRTGNAGADGDLVDPMTTRGDIIVRNASNAVARLAVGAANRVLISDGTDPAYGQVPLASAVSGTLPVANGGTGATSLAGANIMTSNTATRITANMGFTPVTDASSSNSVTFDFSTGNISKITLSENIASVTLSGATAGDILHIQITQDSSARTISGWPAAVKWSGGGTAPTISTTSGAVDIVSILFDGSNYWASVTQDHQ